jgi:hypothetical protein
VTARVFRFCVVGLLLASASAFGGVSGIGFVYQPLTTMGTDDERQIIVAKVPIIGSGPLENLLSYVGAPNRLLQRGPEIVEDSNLLSCLGISVSGESIDKSDHYVATLDLSDMKLTSRYGVSEEAVVKAALQCIRKTIDETELKKIWKIRIIPRKQDGAKWHKFETDYRPHPILKG